MVRVEIKDRQVENPAIIVEYKIPYRNAVVPCEWMTVESENDKQIVYLWSTLSWTEISKDEEGNINEVGTAEQAVIAKFPLNDLISVSKAI